ncbi:MAG: response regulator [Elusimicrobia bacterium]|nr:response regulator [Elusimicrobiota bacterium]
MARTLRILCIDDEPANLVLLEGLLGPRGYDVIKATSGQEGLKIIREQEVDIVLLDVLLPQLDGYTVCKKIKEDVEARNIPIIMITALASKEDRIRSIEVGAEDFISKPFDQAEVLARIGMLLKIRESEDAFTYTVYALARAAEINDEDTGNHILRVGEYCAIIAANLKMSPKIFQHIRIQATLHDVGKIHIPSVILRNPGKLTPEEWSEIKKHPIYGARIIGDHPRLSMAKSIALTHHERWDGSGYPYGLKGEKIPMEGRIVIVADQYDALRNPRVYKPAYDHQTTYKIITEGDGRTMPSHFDPLVLAAFKNTASQFAGVHEKLKE